MPKYASGDAVQWSWGSGTASGVVRKTFTSRVTRTMKGSEVTRDADDENPAYEIEQEDGDRVLKSETELKKAS